jgi:microcystin degradation protein MlrC
MANYIFEKYYSKYDFKIFKVLGMFFYTPRILVLKASNFFRIFKALDRALYIELFTHQAL